MSYSDSSQLLNKQVELKDLQTKYDTYIGSYRPIASTSTTPLPTNTNAISNSNPPSGVSPGEDFGEYWKFISSGATNASACWSFATRDPRVFQKVVYTGEGNPTSTATNKGDAAWNKQCYGLIWNAPPAANYNTVAPGYSTMVSSSNNGFIDAGVSRTYTKTGITTSAALNEATEIADLKSRIDSLIEEIALIAGSSINSELSALSQTSGDQNTVIQKINRYMNSSAQQIDASNNIINQRKNMNNIYEDVNKQITLNSRKFKFVLYCLVGVIFIITYFLYVSKIIVDPGAVVSIAVSWGWWFNWGVVTFVVGLLLMSSFGWDMRGNIMMIWRYLSDPEFWTGQMWWVGVTFLFLIVIFLQATFKSFFAPAMADLEKMGEESSE
jgi:hypothetical protein